MNVNENLIIENVTQVKRITINANASAKFQKNMFETSILGILVHVLVEMVNIKELLFRIP